MKKSPNPILIGIIVVILIPILILGWLGFVPILSTILGADSPRDLNVRYTETDRASELSKEEVNYLFLSSATEPKDSLKFEGQKAIDTTFTQEELTARMNNHKWKYWVTKKTQVRINPDGSVEVSGVLLKNNLKPFGEALEISEEKQSRVLDKIGIIQNDPSFYVKFDGGIQNNQATVDVKELQIGRLNIDPNIVPAGELNSFAEEVINSIPGVSVEKATIEDGKLHFKGTLPEKISRLEK